MKGGLAALSFLIFLVAVVAVLAPHWAARPVETGIPGDAAQSAFAAPRDLTRAGTRLGTSPGIKFRAPRSLTVVQKPQGTLAVSGKSLLRANADVFDKLVNTVTRVKSVNLLSVPSFFNCSEKWPGCLPRPLFQGTCGSCWGFAAVTALSSRFFIESCGNSGCNNYPQITKGSFDDVVQNLNYEYSFKNDSLGSFTDVLDANKDKFMDLTEWLAVAKRLQTEYATKKGRERHAAAQVLVFMLDFQSLGSVNLSSQNSVLGRARKTFAALGLGQARINVSELQKRWRDEPVALSAEKLISCCSTCMKMDLAGPSSSGAQNPACDGGSLVDAWTLLRDMGTPTSLCIGYNLDNYSESSDAPPPSCKELQGPFYSFCSGYRGSVFANISGRLKKLEDAGTSPAAIPDTPEAADGPWIDPQLFRFRAKNAYKVSADVSRIQAEIMERGPVTTGFLVYADFQDTFGSAGLGGQKYAGGDPLGASETSLIYMRDPAKTDSPVGGHAVTIVGWGTFRYTDKSAGQTRDVYVPYWTCLNSWGSDWGHSGFPAYTDRMALPTSLSGGGYFWMVRGLNNCGIEENVVCGQPDLENISFPGVIDRYGWGSSLPSDASYLAPLDLSDRRFPDSSRLEIFPSEEGGGTYVNYVSTPPGTWQLKSMEIPSPFLMFWPKHRPKFCLGATAEQVSESATRVKVTPSVVAGLTKVLAAVRNPLVILGSDTATEQAQVLGLGPDAVTLSRGVNYNRRLAHAKGTRIAVFPYNELTERFLRSSGLGDCSGN